MKLKLLILSAVLIISLFSCNNDTRNSESSMTESNSSENETISEERRETWTETETNNNEKITTEYRNYGDDWTRTVETYDSSDVIIEKQEFIIVNREIVKNTIWSYNEDGSLSWVKVEITNEDGTITENNEYYDYDNGVLEVIESSYRTDGDEGKELIKSSAVYERINDETPLAKVDKYYDTVDGKKSLIKETTYYKDGIVHHHVGETTSVDDTTYSRAIFDTDLKPIYKYCYEDSKAIQVEVYYRAEGFLQVVMEGNYFVYYESLDGVNMEWFVRIELDAESGEVKQAICNGDSYTEEKANELLDEISALYTSAVEFSSVFDYKPLG